MAITDPVKYNEFLLPQTIIFIVIVCLIIIGAIITWFWMIRQPEIKETLKKLNPGKNV